MSNGAEQVERVLEVGFLHCARFEAEGQSVWVGGNADSGDFEQLLLEIFTAMTTGVVAVFPAKRNEADGDGAEEAPAIEAVGDAGDRIEVRGELDLLVEDMAAGDGADLSEEGFAQGEYDVAVLVGVLENRVPAIVFDAPTAGEDDFAVAIKGFVRGNKLQT